MIGLDATALAGLWLIFGQPWPGDGQATLGTAAVVAGMVVQAYEALGEPEATQAAERRALARCEKILADEPDHSGALGFLVTSLAGLGQAERARDWTRRALLFDPDNARLHYNIACAMSRLGDADTAVDLIEPWIEKVSLGWLMWMQKD